MQLFIPIIHSISTTPFSGYCAVVRLCGVFKVHGVQGNVALIGNVEEFFLDKGWLSRNVNNEFCYQLNMEAPPDNFHVEGGET